MSTNNTTTPPNAQAAIYAALTNLQEIASQRECAQDYDLKTKLLQSVNHISTLLLDVKKLQDRLERLEQHGAVLPTLVGATTHDLASALLSRLKRQEVDRINGTTVVALHATLDAHVGKTNDSQHGSEYNPASPVVPYDFKKPALSDGTRGADD